MRMVSARMGNTRQARTGLIRHCLIWHGDVSRRLATRYMAGVYRSDGASRGETGPGLFWRDMARSDDTRQAWKASATCAMAGFGKLRQCLAWFELLRSGTAGVYRQGPVRLDMAGRDRIGIARRILAGSGATWPGTVGRGLARPGNTRQA